MAHRHIAVFVPQLGCPHRCVFCDQRSITGHEVMSPETAREQIIRTLDTLSKEDEIEIAFFGGSFTGLPEPLIRKYLDTALQCMDAGNKAGFRMTGIRMSTRPDFISDATIELLRSYPVTAVELGVQSMDDRVLALSKRGHTANDTVLAAEKLRQAGIPWVAQLMIGLPGADPSSEKFTAAKVLELCPCASRIYPTVVFAGSELETMMRKGSYVPLSLEDAVERGAAVLEILQRGHLPVLRIGLCASEELSDSSCAVAGATHPAIGELIRSQTALRQMEQLLDSQTERTDPTTFRIPVGMLSVCIGQKRCNVNYLKSKYNLKRIIFTEQTVPCICLSADAEPENGGHNCF